MSTQIASPAERARVFHLSCILNRIPTEQYSRASRIRVLPSSECHRPGPDRALQGPLAYVSYSHIGSGYKKVRGISMIGPPKIRFCLQFSLPVFLLSLTVAVPSYAFDFPLPPEAIRDAYFLGIRQTSMGPAFLVSYRHTILELRAGQFRSSTTNKREILPAAFESRPYFPASDEYTRPPNIGDLTADE